MRLIESGATGSVKLVDVPVQQQEEQKEWEIELLEKIRDEEEAKNDEEDEMLFYEVPA